METGKALAGPCRDSEVKVSLRKVGAALSLAALAIPAACWAAFAVAAASAYLLVIVVLALLLKGVGWSLEELSK